MSCDVLSAASGAETVSCAVVAVPVLVLYQFLDVILVVCPDTEATELPLTLIVDVWKLLWTLFAAFLAQFGL